MHRPAVWLMSDPSAKPQSLGGGNVQPLESPKTPPGGHRDGEFQNHSYKRPRTSPMRRLPESPSARTGIGGGALFRKPAMNAAPVTARARSEPRLVRETFSSSRLLEFCSAARADRPDRPLGRRLAARRHQGADRQRDRRCRRGRRRAAGRGYDIARERRNRRRRQWPRHPDRDRRQRTRLHGQSVVAGSLRIADPRRAGQRAEDPRRDALRTRRQRRRDRDRGQGDRASDPVHGRSDSPRTADFLRSRLLFGKNRNPRHGAWPAKACRLLDDDEGRFLPFCWDYVALNPHLALSVKLPDGESINWPEPTTPDWEKWRPTDQIPAHWYSAERLQRLIAACINRDQQNGKRVRLLREFVRDFRGLTGSAKLAAVLDELGLSRARLDMFFQDDRVDHDGIARLLAAMQQHSKPVKPERLGLIGREHFGRIFAVDGADPDQVKYSRELGHDGDLPFVVEAAFARIKDLSSTPLVSGINWSPAIGDPFRWSAGAWSHHSLRGLVRDRHILAGTPALIGVSLATPTVSFVDRGKSAAMLTRAVGKAVETAVTKVTKEWFEAWEAEQRRRRQHVRAVERHIEELEKEERAHERRQRAATVGTGKLHAEIAAAAEQNGVSITRLTVLSTRLDPYRRDTTDGHRDGQWFADQIAPLPPNKKIHLRGLFYRIVSAGDIRRPDGSLFINDHGLLEMAAGHGR